MSDNGGIPTAGDRAAQMRSAIDHWNGQLAAGDRREKYERMKSSAFVFYRGTNHLFWEDFAGDSRLNHFGDAGTRTWLQGDLHVENLGAFGNDEGVVVYDINDYDEAVIADYQYDLWRMAVSIVLVARQDDELSRREQGKVIDAFAASYLDQLRHYSESGGEEIMVFDSLHTSGKLAAFLNKLKDKASRARMLDQWTHLVGLERRFDLADNQGKLAAVSAATCNEIIEAMGRYVSDLARKPDSFHAGYFAVRDVAQRLSAGTGSLGVNRFYVLIAGADESPQSNRILDIKRQLKPTAYHFLSDQHEYDEFLHSFPGQDAKWHEAAYRAMAKDTDDHLGWMELSDGFYSVRERTFFQDTFDTEGLDRDDFVEIAQQWGRVLATDHARAPAAFDMEFSGTVPGQPFRPRVPGFKEQVVARTAGRDDELQALVCEVAFSYADQVKADWKAFKA